MAREILVCSPVSQDGTAIPGAVKEACKDCGRPVWVSSSSLLLIHDHPGMIVLCPVCALIQVSETKNLIIRIQPTPAQLEEIEEALD